MRLDASPRATPLLPLVVATRVTAATAWATVGVLLVLLGVSLVLRTRALDAPFWIDEALSVGIASYPLEDIAGVLRQDGSPPLYYVLLHGWLELVGPTETQTHLLSLVFALAATPAALWAGWSLFGRRVGWLFAFLTAVSPFLTAYGQETRMYALVALLALVATAAFLHAFVHRRRRYLALFALTLAALLYTHNWGVFFAVGSMAALAVCARVSDERASLLRDAAVSYGAVALLYAPWVPTLLYQAEHTGAPWSKVPSATGMLDALGALLGGDGPAVAIVLGAGAGLIALLRESEIGERTAVAAMLALVATTVVTAWLASLLEPAWAHRYFAVVVGPVLLLSAVGFARAGRLGAVALAIAVVYWVRFEANDAKSNADEVAAIVAERVRPGDLVLSTHPEQVPVLHYYLPSGLRYATPLGPTADPRVMDWRDAVERLDRSSVQRTLVPLVDSVARGRNVVLVQPVVVDPDDWDARWQARVLRRTREWSRALRADDRLVRVTVVRPYDDPTDAGNGVWAVVYRKVVDSPDSG